MLRLLTEDWPKTIVLGIVLAALGAILVAILLYATAAISLSNNRAHQLRANGEEIATPNQGEAQMLMASDIERRELVHRQNIALIVGGVGIVLLAAGWLLNDLLMARQRKTASG